MLNEKKKNCLIFLPQSKTGSKCLLTLTHSNARKLHREWSFYRIRLYPVFFKYYGHLRNRIYCIFCTEVIEYFQKLSLKEIKSYNELLWPPSTKKSYFVWVVVLFLSSKNVCVYKYLDYMDFSCEEEWI